MLYGQDDKRFDREYQRQLEKNWLRWKGKMQLEKIKKEKEKEEKVKGDRIEEWDEKDKMRNLQNSYNNLQEKFLGREFLRRGYYYESL